MSLQRLNQYGDRAKIYTEQLRRDLDKASEVTVRQIVKQLPREKLCGRTQWDVIQAVRPMLGMRMEVLRNLLSASALQMKNYMLLWDYQDAGFTHYCLLTEGENCDDCNNLEGQVIPISAARVGENFPPMHPNCNCRVGILDEENRIVTIIYKGEEHEAQPEEKSWLDSISNLLTAASLIPGVDTFTNLVSIPVDLARGDWLSAGLSAVGMIPVIGEVGDTAKLVKMADKTIDAVKVTRTTKNSKLIIKVTNKSSALKSVETLPSNIQKSAKSFFKGSSNNYNSYSVIKNKNNTYTIKMENPGKVPGSKAVYNKIVDSDGKTIKVYKDTFDPSGNLVHRKDK